MRVSFPQRHTSSLLKVAARGSLRRQALARPRDVTLGPAREAEADTDPLPRGVQGIKDGYQVEMPDIWLTNGNPWELKRPGIKYPVGFYGSVVNGKWEPEEKVRVAVVIMSPPATPVPMCPFTASRYQPAGYSQAVQRGAQSC